MEAFTGEYKNTSDGVGAINSSRNHNNILCHDFTQRPSMTQPRGQLGDLARHVQPTHTSAVRRRPSVFSEP